MSSTLQQKINDLERRLQLENKSRDHDRSKSMGMGNDFSLARPPKAESGHPSPARRPRPGLGDMSIALSRPSSAPPPNRRKPAGNLELPNRPRPRGNLDLPNRPRQYDGAEIEQKYQEIMKMTQILTFNGEKYKADINELETLGDLGHGTCGQVIKMAHKPTRHLMAVKQMRRSGNKEENKRIIMDLEVVLKCTDYPFIVQCIGCFITASEVWICMELMSTCLDKLLKRTKTPIPERIMGKMAVAIVKALNYLKEEHGVIHRDVKPSNILLDENGTVKLCDFGISGRLVDSKAKTRSAGCAAYMAVSITPTVSRP